ncbi:unnamed protein product, partial [Discosporangium mesarthrocarpum]
MGRTRGVHYARLGGVAAPSSPRPTWWREDEQGPGQERGEASSSAVAPPGGELVASDTDDGLQGMDEDDDCAGEEEIATAKACPRDCPGPPALEPPSATGVEVAPFAVVRGPHYAEAFMPPLPPADNLKLGGGKGWTHRRVRGSGKGR